jgi:hypothetical protein
MIYRLGLIISLSVTITSCVGVREAVRRPSLPTQIFGPLCETLLTKEGLDRNQRILVLTKTRPFSQMIALDFAYNGSAENVLDRLSKAEALDTKNRAVFVPLSVILPSLSRRCRWVAAMLDFKKYTYSRHFLLELSNPMRNPYASQQEEPYGIFVRFSLGGQAGAGWYWIALRHDANRWEVVRVFPLDISDG